MSLEFRHIAHSYRGAAGEVAALTDVSLAAAGGEITCLLGASGSGKSTLLGLAAGLLEVQRGEILVGGTPLAAPGHHPPPEARGIGLVFQDGALFPHMTIAKNVAFGLPRAERGAAEDWLARVGLAGLGGRYPHELSGGQQQRAALARAMAPRPRVLLMDEPFASVDIVLRRSLRRECRHLLRRAGTTVVMVTHDPEEALDLGDRIAVMEAGRIVQFGAPGELRETPVSAGIGAMFGGAQVLRARISHGGIETALGRWPVTAIAGNIPETDEFDLLMPAGALDCEEDDEGFEALDVQALGGQPDGGEGRRVLLQARAGDGPIAIHTNSHVEEGKRYRVVPRLHSLRAFERG
ncbi:ABC transporter ATP-binding protein [Erythrobacter sp.]|uniref:ABC transporter ATP-binding protein n=1 Tax=Erythrobacter sp. TaxID=1042 RepID=UPI002ECDD30B|nr:ABC transporter ATP-binding protein [Erythrobacter sp.]